MASRSICRSAEPDVLCTIASQRTLMDAGSANGCRIRDTVALVMRQERILAGSPEPDGLEIMANDYARPTICIAGHGLIAARSFGRRFVSRSRRDTVKRLVDGRRAEMVRNIGVELCGRRLDGIQKIVVCVEIAHRLPVDVANERGPLGARQRQALSRWRRSNCRAPAPPSESASLPSPGPWSSAIRRAFRRSSRCAALPPRGG